MSLLAEFDAASPDLVLGQTLQAMPSLTIDLERQYALDPSRPIAFCWATCGDFSRLETTLEEDGTVDEFQRLSRSDEVALYRVIGADGGAIDAYSRWVSVGGELLECHGTDGRWELSMRFPDRDAFSEYHGFLEARGVDLELHRLANGEDVRTDAGGLTDSQREALLLAYEHGFFDVPRETTLTAIAEALDISNQAVSERIRRGQARLVEKHLVSD
ncbi:helix-turn-helix domain-containing protein [Halopiger goleimassiliensis]|uniref:helix-turn-helix domain-containing protein n=1 Tax=Halopiger goleimassiliensis TaxID=1293048 RepID=UPI0006780330|nr:helix-turn-helix domain-containing protein [Halopiger goleimassiliensis]